MSRINIQSSRGTIDLRPVMGRLGPQGPQGADSTVQGPQGAQGEQGPQGLPGTGAVPADEAVAGYIGTAGTSATKTALGATIARSQRGLTFEPSRNVVENVAAGTNPTPIDALDDWLYGSVGNKLYRTQNPDGGWTLVATLSGTGDAGYKILGLLPLGDGEVLALKHADGVWKSSGWASNPLTATWARVLDTAPGVAVPFSVSTDPDSGWVTVGAYGLSGSNSRYAWLSTDNGATWTVVYDFAGTHAAEWDPTKSHHHFLLIDKYHNPTTPRLWLFFHTPFAGFLRTMYSDDSGATWTTIDTVNSVQSGIATPEGMVFVSDGPNFNGLWIVPRTGPLVLKQLLRLRRDVDIYWGIGTKSTLGSDGIYYFSFRSAVGGLPPSIMASDGYRAAEVLTLTPNNGSDAIDLVTVAEYRGKLYGTYTHTGDSSYWTFSADAPLRGVPVPTDNGLTGGAAGERSVAAGGGAIAGLRTLALGVGAAADGQDRVALGHKASVSATFGVAIGSSASVTGAGVAIGASRSAVDGVTIGHLATSVGEGTSLGISADSVTDGVAVGAYSNAGAGGTALGRQADANGGSGSGVAVGRAATATATGAVALGALANATHTFSVALGYDADTTANEQVQIKGRHIEMKEVALPAAPAADSARVYAVDSGGGKTQLAVRFNTGLVQVIASESGARPMPVYVTASRPTGATKGATMWDDDLKKPIWFNGSVWLDAGGVAV